MNLMKDRDRKRSGTWSYWVICDVERVNRLYFCSIHQIIRRKIDFKFYLMIEQTVSFWTLMWLLLLNPHSLCNHARQLVCTTVIRASPIFVEIVNTLLARKLSHAALSKLYRWSLPISWTMWIEATVLFAIRNPLRCSSTPLQLNLLFRARS